VILAYDKLELTKEEVEILDNISPFLSLSYRPAGEGNPQFFVHSLMPRAGGDDSYPKPGAVSSTYYDFFHNIFKNFCEKNSIKVNMVLRSAVNFSFSEPYVHSPIHVDHTFPHNVFIAYLNNFSCGETLLFDDNNVLVDKIVPEKYCAVVFDGQKHAIAPCSPYEIRIVLVTTFV